MRTRRFLKSETNSFWEVTWDGRELETISGTNGKKVRAYSRVFRSESDLEAWLEEAIAKRLNDGYGEVALDSVAVAVPVLSADQVPVDCGALIEFLANAKTDEEEPWLDLGVHEQKHVRWSRATAKKLGARMARGLEVACQNANLVAPRSLVQCLKKWAGPFVNTGGFPTLVEDFAQDFLGPGLPLERLWDDLLQPTPVVESHQRFVDEQLQKNYRSLQGALNQYIHIGRSPAKGVMCSARWDDPMLLASEELGSDGEPLWLVYLAEQFEGVPPCLPLALEFEAVLLLHLTGVFVALAAGEPQFVRLLEKLRTSRFPFRTLCAQALLAAEKAANATLGCTNVRAPWSKEKAPAGVLIAALRELRGAAIFTADPQCDGWMDVPFIGATLSDFSLVGACKTIEAREAPEPVAAIMRRAFIDAVGGFFAQHPPMFCHDSIDHLSSKLKAAGVTVLRPDAFGDVTKSSSLAGGAQHVLSRARRLNEALIEQPSFF